MKKVAAVCHTNTDDNFFFQGREDIFLLFSREEKHDIRKRQVRFHLNIEGRAKEGVTRQK